MVPSTSAAAYVSIKMTLPGLT